MVEYCSPVWSPVAVTLINQLESVQRRFTKRLPGFQTLPYDERCALLGLDRLELRRLRATLIPCYKVWFCCHPTVFSTFICNSRTRGHSFKLFYRIHGLIVVSIFFRCPIAENLELTTRRWCFGWSFVVVYSSFGTCKIKSIFDRQDLDAFICSVLIFLDRITTLYLHSVNLIPGCL